MEAPRRPELPRRIALWLAWWCGLMVVWLLLVDTLERQELLVGALAAGIAATLAVAVHQQGYIRFSPKASWLRETPSVVWDTVVDCGILAAALWRKLLGEPVHGVTIRVPFHYGGDTGR